MSHGSRRRVLRSLGVLGVASLAGCGSFLEAVTFADEPVTAQRSMRTPTATLTPVPVSTEVPTTISTGRPGPTETPTLTPTPAGTPRQVSTARGDTPETRRLTAKLVASDGEPEDRFGIALATAEEWVVVGSPHDENRNGRLAGSAYVFERVDGEWTRRGKLLADREDIGDRLGFSVAVAGETVLVGAANDDDPNGKSGGSAYVFERSDGEWALETRFGADDGDADDHFGRRVALDGDAAFVGAPNDERSVGASAGSVYVFERVDDEWTQRAKLTADDGDPYDWFGANMSVSDGVALVGARNDDDPHGETDNGRGCGSAYVFERTEGEWVQRTKLSAEDGEPGDQFGWDVALADETALVGAPQADNHNGRRAGEVYVFDRVDGEWVQRDVLVAEEGESEDVLGSAVAIDGETAFVGVPGEGRGEETNVGSVYRYVHGDDGWVHESTLVADDGDGTDLFGAPLALTADRCVAGASSDEDPNGRFAGSAYVFDR